MAEQDAVISAGMDVSPVNDGFVAIAAGAESMASKVKRSADSASKAVDGIGDAGDALGERFTRGENQMRKAIERADTQLRSLQKTASEKLEMEIEIKGLDRAKFEPYLNALKETERATKSLNEEQSRRQSQEAFIASLKSQADALNMTRGELLRYQAAQAGASTEAEQYIRQIEKAGGQSAFFGQTLKNLSAAAAALGVTLSAGALFSTFIRETVSAEQEQAQLAAVLLSTGEAAGWSREQLNEMADGMAGVLSSGDITKAQTRLLSYVGVVGQQFPRAMQNAVDMAVRMGMSVEQAAETVGRALDVPSEGLTALTRQGFRFTEEQKAMVKALEETGRVAEAQAIILDALESSYGGAALAAKNTLGGALSGLKNAFNDLMTGDSGTVSGMTASVKSMEEALRSEGMQQAFNAVLTGLKGIAATAIGVVAAIDLMSKALAGVAAIGDITLVEDMSLLERLTPLGAIKGIQNIAGIGGKIDEARAQLNVVFEDMDSTAQKYGDVLSKIFSTAATEVEKTVPPIQAVTSALGEATGATVVNQAALTEYMSKFGSGAEKMAAQISIAMAQAKKDFGGVVPPEVEAQIKKFYATQSSGAKAASASYQQWASSIAEKTAALRQELDGTNRLTESQKLLNKLNAELYTGRLKMNASALEKIKVDIAELAGLERLRKETERSVKAYQEWIKTQQELAEESVKLSKAKESLQQWTYKESQALERSGELLKLEASLIGATDKQRQIAVATLQSEILLREQLDAIDANRDVDEPAREEARIEARKRHAERVAQAETAIYIAEWDKTSQLIGQTLSDYIMGGGKDAAQYLKRLFATLVLQPIVNYGVQGVLGMFGGGAGNAATAAAGGGMGLNPFSALSGLNSLGLLGNFGAGMSAGAAGWAGTLGMASTGTTVGGSMSAGMIALQNGNIMGGLGTLAGVIGPVVAGLGVLASVLGAFDKPTPHQGAVGYYTTQGGSENYQAGQTQYNAEIGGILETLSSSVGASFEAFLTSFGLDNNVAVTTNWADDFNGKGESWGYFALAMQDAFGEWTNLVDWRENGGPEVRHYTEGEAGFEEYALDVYRSFVDGLKQVDIPAWATGVLDQIGDDASLDQINAVLAQLGVMKDTLASWQTYLVEFANVGDEAFGALLESMGGFENLSTGVAAFVDLFYSDAEKLEMSQKQIAEQLAKFDLEMPMLDLSDETMDTAEEVKAAWRAMVEEALAAGEEGAELAAMLLNLGPAFSSATDAAESAAQAEAELAQAREDARQAQIDGWMNLGGLSVQSMSQGVMDALKNGEDPGAWLAEHITGGFEQAMQMQALNMVMQRIMDEALAPAMEEIMTDLFGEKSDSTATTAEEAVLKVFDAMDAAFAAVTGESVLNLGAGQVSTGQVDGMQEISNDGLLSLDTTMPEGAAFGSAFESVLVQMKPALEAFANDLSLAGVEAVEGADLTATTDAIGQLLGGLVSEESIAGLAEMLASMPEMDPEQAAAIASLTQESLEALLSGITDGSLGLLDASVFANVAFGGMTDAIVAGSSDMLNATAGASMASSSAVVGHANAAISTIDGAVSFANGKLDEFLSSDLGKQLFGNIKTTPKAATTQRYSSGGSGYTSTINSDASALITAWKSVYDAIYGSMTNLRDAILGTTEDEGNSFYEAQFAMLTAQARAGDQEAAEKLPEIVAKLSEYAQSNSASLYDQNSSIASYIKSLEETQSYMAAFYKKAGGSLSNLEAWDTQSVHQAVSVAPVTVPAKVIPAVDNSSLLSSVNSSGNTALLSEFRAMRTELAAVKAELAAVRSNTEDSAANTRDISRTLNEVTNGGDAMITKEATA